jgi:superfamily II DNA/RNA helicase
MLYPVPEHLKKPMLLELLGETSVESALVFARTKRRTERLARQLAKSGIATAHIHGDCSQSRRVAALEGFRAGRYRVLVATDVAGRGIDVEGISHVINYDMPDTVEAYVHRAGRTARVEAVGQAISLVTPADESTVRAIERTIDQTIERRHLSHFDYTVEPPSYLGRPAGIALQNRVQQPVSLAERWASMSRGTHRPARRKAPAANRVPGRSGSIPGTSMTTRLFVGNLAYATTEEDLHELFARAGSVQSVALPTDRKTGRPRGFGFVEMSTQEDAHKAISMFDGQTLRDRQIKVNESRPREEGRGGRSRSSSNGRARRH